MAGWERLGSNDSKFKTCLQLLAFTSVHPIFLSIIGIRSTCEVMPFFGAITRAASDRRPCPGSLSPISDLCPVPVPGLCPCPLIRIYSLSLSRVESLLEQVSAHIPRLRVPVRVPVPGQDDWPSLSRLCPLGPWDSCQLSLPTWRRCQHGAGWGLPVRPTAGEGCTRGGGGGRGTGRRCTAFTGQPADCGGVGADQNSHYRPLLAAGTAPQSTQPTFPPFTVHTRSHSPHSHSQQSYRAQATLSQARLRLYFTAHTLCGSL